ncbi:MAG TPA: response regulator transcription factor [Phycisphaerae bacterium]|nr:response regulator transcription factor [Phycisphaerae bacterium]
MAIRVVLVDDHQIVVEGLKALLASDPGIEVVGEAFDGAEGIALAERLNPDVIVLDVTMPHMNGIEALREIRRRSPEAEIVGLSMHASGEVVCDMLRAGASGYILKTASVQNLAQAIRTVMTGRTYLSEEIVDQVPRELLRSAPLRFGENAPAGYEIPELTEREREVLKLVAEGKSSKEIANQLFVTTKTIVFHRQSIMDKLGLHSVAELTKYAVRMGITPP